MNIVKVGVFGWAVPLAGKKGKAVMMTVWFVKQ